jgi:quinol monooxygenase YgiN
VVIVTGEVIAKPETRDALLTVCLDHVRRSRAEPGCISHGAFVDAENPLRIFFFERWDNQAALEAHFAVPASNAFMREVRALSAGGSRRPQIFDIP